MKKFSNIKTGFSLIESMIVLLVVAIITACAAPIINKKMMLNASSRSPWLWTDRNGSITYNPLGNNDWTAAIGNDAQAMYNELNFYPKLYIKSGTVANSFYPQIVLATDGGNGNEEAYKILSANDSIVFAPSASTGSNGDIYIQS